ncbi:hypothetical protein GCM10010446_13800 [Streptomyces enissocaesilis]|uniref:Uncharacterized protein n=1 Tax=Streptomyces enissocaesilis TaxID=332589 RepID=A0ABP6JE72_9ACTN
MAQTGFLLGEEGGVAGREVGEVVVAPVGHRPREVGAVLQLEGEEGRGVVVTQSRQVQGWGGRGGMGGPYKA